MLERGWYSKPAGSLAKQICSLSLSVMYLALWEEDQMCQGMCGHSFSEGRNRDLQQLGSRYSDESACEHLEAFLP